MPEIRVSNPDELRQYFPRLHAAGIIAVRLETTGHNPHVDRIRSMLLAGKDCPTLVLDFDTLAPAALRELFSTSAVKIFHDAKTDLQFLIPFGIFPKPLFDASLAAQVLHLPGDPEDFSFHALLRQYSIDLETINLHSVREVESLLRLREAMVPLLYRNGLAKVAEIEFQCVRAVAHIEYHGIYLNRAKWQKLLERTEAQRDAVLQLLYPYTETPAVQKTFWGEETIFRYL